MIKKDNIYILFPIKKYGKVSYDWLIGKLPPGVYQDVGSSGSIGVYIVHYIFYGKIPWKCRKGMWFHLNKNVWWNVISQRIPFQTLL